ncbi:TPA: hypothetical protein QCP34_005603, partial [Bacillus anthracis]|nr:hypothetical protein [Bacillus anthracis]
GEGPTPASSPLLKAGEQFVIDFKADEPYDIKRYLSGYTHPALIKKADPQK